MVLSYVICSFTHSHKYVYIIYLIHEQVLVPFVNCLMILDSSGERIMAKYFDGRVKAEQDKYETLLHKKTKTLSFRSDGE